MKTITTLTLLMIHSYMFAPIIHPIQKDINKYRKEQLSFVKKQLHFANKLLYRQVINNIKKQESKRLNAYYCPSGYKTIGYGHIILIDDIFKNSITENQADSLLISDFNKQLKYIDSDLAYNKRLAIAHFVFNIGVGAYFKSNLYRKIKSGQKIDSEIIKWNKYRDANGVLKESKHLLKARLFELKIYNNLPILADEQDLDKEMEFIRVKYKLYKRYGYDPLQ